MNIIQYCTEEVRRQGHDIEKPEGWKRVGWMLEAWSLMPFLGEVKFIGYDLMEELGRRVEPGKNKAGFRQCDVRVGRVAMPEHQKVPDLITKLCMDQRKFDPPGFYRAFLEIHPFADGNGRVGKILLN